MDTLTRGTPPEVVEDKLFDLAFSVGGTAGFGVITSTSWPGYVDNSTGTPLNFEVYAICANAS